MRHEIKLTHTARCRQISGDLSEVRYGVLQLPVRRKAFNVLCPQIENQSKVSQIETPSKSIER